MDKKDYITDREKQKIRTNNSSEELEKFLEEWFDDSPTLTLQTSGSTGIPKQFIASKEQMIRSAVMTCSYLNLQSGNRALLCMSLQYIGAKMMVVRSLVAGMELIIHPASGHPLAEDIEAIDLAAMVPLQVYNTIHNPEEKERFSKIKHLLIGGSGISRELENAISGIPCCAYSTYGMTETLSHIALRQLNGINRSNRYIPLPGIEVELSTDNTLIIHAPHLNEEPVYTNDIAEIKEDGSFIISGRKDNIINTGGVKIQIEILEEKLETVLPFRLAVTSVPDTKFGERIVLLTETQKPFLLDDAYPLQNILSKFELPQYSFQVPQIPSTPNGKRDRVACKQLAILLVANKNK